jgi:amino acid transporter
MTVAGFLILVILMLLGIWIFVKLAALPGETALARGHPQAEAINVLGWVGLLLGVAPWLVALVWAYIKPEASLTGAVEAKPAADEVAPGS